MTDLRHIYVDADIIKVSYCLTTLINTAGVDS